MNQAILVSFPELFGNKDIQVKDIVIPKIQRNYAQGRYDEHATRVRQNFLNAIYDGIERGNGLTIDFIYGHNNDNGQFIPLDGQQRLTTLFLLYWYAARKSGRTDATFLRHFTYQTRYSARDFCARLADDHFNPFTSGFKGTLSKEIRDQPWFPDDWIHDGTISSMLVMLDAIDGKFRTVDNMYDKLDTIRFYFISLEQLRLTDDIYIKMNSRGKPLTDFENFKAELEKTLQRVDKTEAKLIADKIDTSWTDLLWQYTGGKESADSQPSTDDAFLRYFRFVCDILCYRSNSSPKEKDEFKLLETYFTGTDAKFNAETLRRFFDCWTDTQLTREGKDIDSFFNGFACAGAHEDGKVRLPNNYAVNLFKDCINDYSELHGSRNRRFPLNKIILLYAVIVYLLHEQDVSHEDFVSRFRIVNNLVLNSSDEISDSENRMGGNRMPAILRQVDGIIRYGIISDNIVVGDRSNCPNFNVLQLEEERQKQVFINSHDKNYREALERFEDHPLLFGRVSIIGLDHYDQFDAFRKLFECSWDLIDRALFAMGDYSQRDNIWRIQTGTSNKGLPQAWVNLFHNGDKNKLNKTRKCLLQLLETLDGDINDRHLQNIVETYLNKAETDRQFTWFYYYVKYPSFRIGRYGRYCQYESNPYDIWTVYAAQHMSSNSREVFLSEIKTRCNSNGRKYFGEEYLVKNGLSKVEVYKSDKGEAGQPVLSVDIAQNNGIDSEDRILKAVQTLG